MSQRKSGSISLRSEEYGMEVKQTLFPDTLILFLDISKTHKKILFVRYRHFNEDYCIRPCVIHAMTTFWWLEICLGASWSLVITMVMVSYKLYRYEGGVIFSSKCPTTVLVNCDKIEQEISGYE